MKWTSLFIIGIIFLSSCHRERIYPNTQTQFAEDLSFRLGKWYSISDTTGDAKLEINTLLDTIWFINDTLAGWTGFVPYQPAIYSFFKTYISPLSISNLVYIAPDPLITGKMDTSTHQFGFTLTGDTMVIYWNFTTAPPQLEKYLKMK